jgi:subunit length determinant Wzz-like protein
VFQAIRRYPTVAIVPMIVFAALGAALGFVRSPTYTATSQLSVGQLSANDPGAVGSVVQATAQLASVYSRMVDATDVRRNVAKAVGAGARGSTISATPVPDSPLVKVSATGDSTRKAVTVANAAATALTAYAQRFSDSAGVSQAIFARFRATALKAVQQQDTVDRLKARYARDPSTTNKSALNQAQADLESTQLQRDGLKASYQSSQQNSRSIPALSTFARASGATSDRRSFMQVLALLGLIAGAAVGAALATARLNRVMARLTRP